MSPTSTALRRRRQASAPVIVLAVLLAAGTAGLFFAVTHGGHHRPDAPPSAHPRPAASAHAPAPSPAPQPAATNVPAPAATTIPHVNLGALRWISFGGLQLPVSPAGGPDATQDGLASGFARTPLGALLAAVNIGVRANAQWGPAIFGPTIRHQMTGQDAPALLASCQDAYEQARQQAGIAPGQPLGRAYVAEEAFRWETYTPSDAAVDIVSAGPGDQGSTVRAATRIELVWRHGDWRVVAPVGGDWGNAATQVTSLAAVAAAIVGVFLG